VKYCEPNEVHPFCDFKRSEVREIRGVWSMNTESILNLEDIRLVIERTNQATPGMWTLDKLGESVVSILPTGQVRSLFHLVFSNHQGTSDEDLAFVLGARDTILSLAHTAETLTTENTHLKNLIAYGEYAKTAIPQLEQERKRLERQVYILHQAAEYYGQDNHWRFQANNVRLFDKAVNMWRQAVDAIWQGPGKGPEIAQKALQACAKLLPLRSSATQISAPIPDQSSSSVLASRG
jgi:hypothetical protein